jgi:hypothetical protein
MADLSKIRSKCLLAVLGAVAAGAMGCSPLTSSTVTGCGGLSISSNGGSGAQIAIYGTNVAAQSFLVSGGSSVTFTSLQLSLQSYPTSSTTALFPSGSDMTVAIYQDSSTSSGSTPSPTTPGTLLGGGVLDVSTIPNTSASAQFYTVTLDSPVPLNPTSATVYWVVLSLGGLGSSTQYIGWQGVDAALLPSGQGVLTGTGALGSVTWGSLNTNMTMDVIGGC